MSQDEVQQKLHCRRCGRPRIINRVSKPKGDTVKLYMTCPEHRSEVIYKLPVSSFEETSNWIREHVLLCKKCGQPVDIVGQRAGKLSTAVNINCSEHGSGERLVNNSLLDHILTGVPTTQAAKATPPEPATTAKFCASCGSPVPSGEARFCHHCGASLE